MLYRYDVAAGVSRQAISGGLDIRRYPSPFVFFSFLFSLSYVYPISTVVFGQLGQQTNTTIKYIAVNVLPKVRES